MESKKKPSKLLLVHPITGETQQCFSIGMFMYCNFTQKDGKVYRYSKTKDFIKFFSRWRKQKSVDINQKEKEPTLEGKDSLSN